MNKHLVQHSEEKGNVLIIGAAVVDVIIQLNQLPKTAEDVVAEHKETIVGGCAYNVANILRQLHIKSSLFAPVGKGNYANKIKGQLLQDRVELLLEDTSADNGWNLSIVEKGGERTFITIPGIETRWEEHWFSHIDLSAYDYIYVSGYELEGPSGKIIVDALSKRKQTGKIVFDVGPRVEFLDKEILEKILGMGTIVHANKSEMLMLMGETDVELAAEKLTRLTQEPVVVTLGGEGTLYCTLEESGIVATKPVEVVDTIGAGDAHTGALIAGLARGYSIRQACDLGNVIAGIVVQQQGGNFQL